MNSNHALDLPKERPFSYLELPTSLEILAASKIASKLWLDKYHVQDGDKRGYWVAPESLCKSSVFSCKDMLAISSIITNIIDNYIFIVGKQITVWEDILRRAVLQSSERTVKDKKLVEIFVKGFDGIVFKPNGDIHFQNSARKILMIEEVDILIKFRVACMFCLVDEIKEIWPSVSKTPNVFGISTLMGYWHYTLHNVVTHESDVLGHLADSVREQNWAAFEYFWDILNEERQIFEAIAIMKTYEFDISRHVLLKLNEKQAEEVCGRFDSIFMKLISQEKFSSYAIPLWTCMKNSIPVPVFERILRSLWRMVFNPERHELRKVKSSSALLRKLWSSAPDSLKSTIPESELFAELDSNIRDINCYDSTFMCDVLENVSHESKKEIWANNWYKVIIRASVSDIKKFMKLCSVDEDEIDLSRESNSSKLEELRDYFNSFVNRGLYSELYEYLGFFVKDPNRLETLGKEIIFANLHHICACGDWELAKLRSFIHFIFSDTNTAHKFMEEIISRPECSAWIYNKLDDHRYDDVMNLYLRFPYSPEGNIQNIKRELLIHCFGNFSNGQIIEFDAQKFTEFSDWCCAGVEDMIADLKASINIGDIFQMVLDNLLRELIASKTFNRTVLSKFDEFLRWFFVDWETARSYKSTRVLAYCRDCDLVKFALKDNVLAPRINSILNWGMVVGNDNEAKRRRTN